MDQERHRLFGETDVVTLNSSVIGRAFLSDQRGQRVGVVERDVDNLRQSPEQVLDALGACGDVGDRYVALGGCHLQHGHVQGVDRAYCHGQLWVVGLRSDALFDKLLDKLGPCYAALSGEPVQLSDCLCPDATSEDLGRRRFWFCRCSFRVAQFDFSAPFSGEA